MALISITVNTVNGLVLTSTQARKIPPEEIRLVKATTAGAQFHLFNGPGAKNQVLVADEKFNAVFTTLGTTNFQRVTASKIDSHEYTNPVPVILRKEFMRQVIADGSGGSFVHYDKGKGADLVKLQVLESPAALLANVSSSSGSFS